MGVIGETLASLREQLDILTTPMRENTSLRSLGIAASCLVLYASFKFFNCAYQTAKARQKIERRQAKAASNTMKMERRLQLAKNIDISLTDLPFADLQSKLQRGDLLPSQVLLAYQAKALEATKNLNCVTEFIESAEELAHILDTLEASKRGPLHGIPFSVKEGVGIKGMDCTSGMSYFVDDIKSDDGVMVKVLISQGAIPFAKTNLSQAQISIACSNPIFGETIHPRDGSRTPGGSCGGEGALMGAGASIMGIGCDMGGSIRIPCHFCGVAGMKPTPFRSSAAGNFETGQGIVTIGEMYGPMGRDVTAVIEMFKASISTELYDLDPLLPQLSWREEVFNSTKPMKIGFYLNDGGMECTPAVTRAVLEAKTVLERQGHTVVKFKPPNSCDVMRDFLLSTVFGDGAEEVTEFLKYDKLDPMVKEFLSIMSVPSVVKSILSRLLWFLHPVEKAMLASKPPMVVRNWWKLNIKIEKFRREFIKTWKDMDLDCIICPVLPFVAFPLGNESSAGAGITYTGLYNVLGMPAGTVPVTSVEKRDLDALEREYPRRNRAERYVYSISKDTLGLPVGVQCAALPFQEETTLRLMRDVEKGMKC